MHDTAERNAMIRCVLLLLGIVAVGTLGFHLIEKQWDFWDCFYFTIVTITTVGYGDYGLDRGGQMFAAFLMVSGLGVFTYSLTTLVRIATDSEAARRRKMKRDIAHLKGHIVICGYGRMGRTICEEVIRGGLDVVVIENAEEGVEDAIEDGLLVIEGEASDDETLLRAGIERAQGIVCAVDTDAENMFITVTVRDINPNCTVISRAESNTAGRKLQRAGASLVVSPHQMAGTTAASALLNPRLTKFMGSHAEDHHSFQLGEVQLQMGCELDGQTIIQFGGKAEGLCFVAIERANGEMVIRPRGFETFYEGDVVIFVGNKEDKKLIEKAAECPKRLRKKAEQQAGAEQIAG